MQGESKLEFEVMLHFVILKSQNTTILLHHTSVIRQHTRLGKLLQMETSVIFILKKKGKD